MNLLTIRQLSKSYPLKNKTNQVLDGLDLNLKKESITCLLGKSGSGKTTLFRLIAGLEQADSGEILFCDNWQQTDLALMQQKTLLLPHLTVLKNCALPKRIQGLDALSAENQARQLLEEVGLLSVANHLPSALSGGMQQRVSFVRTFLLNRQLLLLDEPFSALDAITRRQLQLWYVSMTKKFKQTTLLITHDIEEALLMADTICVLQQGKIVWSKSLPSDKKAYETSVNWLEDKQMLLSILSEK